MVAAFSSLCSNGRCRLMCTCATCYWLNRRVLGNIEADKRYTQPDTYKHSPRRGTLSWSMWGSLRLAPIILICCTTLQIGWIHLYTYELLIILSLAINIFEFLSESFEMTYLGYPKIFDVFTSKLCSKLKLLGRAWASPTLIMTTYHVAGNVCMYLAACSVCPPQCSREHAYSINNT